MALSPYIREKGTGQLYKLGAGGYYQKYSGDTGGVSPVEAGSLGDYFSQQARSQVDPYYNERAATTKTEGEKSLNDARTRLAALYSDRGMGNSTFYTGDVTNTTNSMNSDLSGRLAELERARNSEYSGLYDKYTTKQTEGERYDYELEQERARAERERQQWEAEMAAAAEARAHEARMAELQYKTAQTNSSGSGSGKVDKNALKREMTSHIKANLAHWAKNGKPAFWTEDVLIPQMILDYPELTEKDIKTIVYATRKGSEYGGE